MYQKAIVTFIDILGFRDLINKSEWGAVLKALNKIEESTSPVSLNDEQETDDRAQVVSFSDSIVRVRKIETEANINYPMGLLFQELISLVHAQGELIDFDIIIRGGVSIGEIFISENRVFGPGVIKAYDLENKYAKYPRIILDPELISEYKNNKLLKAKWHSIDEESEILIDLLKQGDDGMWFVNYAKAIETELDDIDMYPIFLKRHKEVILAGAAYHEKLNNALSKFIWMAHYHNDLILTIKQKWFKYYNLKKKDLLINSSELPALQYVNP